MRPEKAAIKQRISTMVAHERLRLTMWFYKIAVAKEATLCIILNVPILFMEPILCSWPTDPPDTGLAAALSAAYGGLFAVLDVCEMLWACEHLGYFANYLRRRLASEGIVTLAFTLSRCVCPPH